MVANDSEVSGRAEYRQIPGLHPLCSLEWGISAFAFIPPPTPDSLLLVFLTSQVQNQANPSTQSLSKFYIFKMDPRARRYLKEMNRDEISDTHNDLEGSSYLMAIPFLAGPGSPAVVHLPVIKC